MADNSVAGPVSDLEFSRAMGPLSPDRQVAVAVSGGADSMALLHLTRRWLMGLEAAGPPADLTAMTVDHGLRAASAAEAQQVAVWCQALGVSHQILHWRGSKPQSDIQAAARQARYTLLTQACRQINIRCLLLGHQFEDQAENFLLRLGRGSGVDGLAAMAPVREWNGVRLLRPLLGFSGQRLRATLEAFAQPWLEDPSNRDPRFARVRARAALAGLADAGISPERLVATAQRMRRVRAALEQATAQLVQDAVQWDQAGFASLCLDALFAAPEEIGLRALARVLMGVGGQEYPPRLQQLERLFAWLRQRPVRGGRTLSGCGILPRRKKILVVRELAALGPDISLSPGEEGIWDKRFEVRLSETVRSASGMAPCTVRGLGSAGLRQLRRVMPANAPIRLVCQGLPGLWKEEKLLAAPHLGFLDPVFAADATFEVKFSPGNALQPDQDFGEGKA